MFVIFFCCTSEFLLWSCDYRGVVLLLRSAVLIPTCYKPQGQEDMGVEKEKQGLWWLWSSGL